MSFTQPLSAIDALRRDVAHTFVETRKRIEIIETTLAALAPLQDNDRMTVARICQATGVSLQEIDRRDASAGRARKINRLFHALRQRGWSFDRIAKATDYSTRGVASNLEKFSQSAVQEKGAGEGQKPPTLSDPQKALPPDANLSDKQ